MARILDKDTRIIDADFGPVNASFSRTAGAFNPTSITLSLNGEGQIINFVAATNPGCGSFVQYNRIDLSFMLNNNEAMQPVDVSVQRTSPVPLGFSNDGNNFDQIEEYVYIFSRPLNNEEISGLTNITDYEEFRMMGLERAQSRSIAPGIAGNSGWPDQEQTIYAEKRMYSVNLNNAATKNNGALVLPSVFNELAGMPQLDSVTTWGSLGAITGPNLHCYRVILDRSQTFPTAPNTFANEALDGSTTRIWPPVNVSFLCKDPNYSEGEYLTRLANAMSSNAEGGPTA